MIWCWRDSVRFRPPFTLIPIEGNRWNEFDLNRTFWIDWNSNHWFIIYIWIGLNSFERNQTQYLNELLTNQNDKYLNFTRFSWFPSAFNWISIESDQNQFNPNISFILIKSNSSNLIWAKPTIKKKKNDPNSFKWPTSSILSSHHLLKWNEMNWIILNE